ncbi:MAG: thiamine phosphate synthase [Phycisphaerae bacterium]|nr:thiamine phosphate synthase [Phycisphaerae bacterium]
MDPVARILDANANRAAEAIRTLEDLSRFALNDPRLAADLKQLRHELTSALQSLPQGWLVANRDVTGDVGTTISTETEYARCTLSDVAAAAGSRLAEALRSIEEMAKTIDPALARGIEALRYRSYSVAADVIRRTPGRRSDVPAAWRVCVLVTESLCKRPWRDVVRAALDGGADAIQVREKDCDAAPLVERVAWVLQEARPRRVQVIVNDRVDVALACNADGVHVGQTDLDPRAIQAIAGRRLLIGMSTHNADEAERAVQAGVDYCGVGAMFHTDVKPTAAASGVAWLREYVRRFGHIPHLAIGGVSVENIAALVDAGCRGVAVSSCVCGADYPDRVVAALRCAFDQASVGAPA